MFKDWLYYQLVANLQHIPVEEKSYNEFLKKLVNTNPKAVSEKFAKLLNVSVEKLRGLKDEI